MYRRQLKVALYRCCVSVDRNWCNEGIRSSGGEGSQCAAECGGSSEGVGENVFECHDRYSPLPSNSVAIENRGCFSTIPLQSHFHQKRQFQFIYAQHIYGDAEPGLRGGFPSKPRGFFEAVFGKARPGARPDHGVDTREPENSYWEDEARQSSSPGKNRQLVAVPAGDDRGTTKDVSKVTETAVDKGANVATSALDNVGSILTKTGLEVELEELTIEKLVLKDLGLVLVIKTKPQPQPAPATPPEPQSGPPDSPQ